LSRLWKLIPAALRWRAIWALHPRFLVGVNGVVLNEQGEVLVAHHIFRGENPWGLPGGIVNRGEGLIQALQREIREETSLQVEVGPLLQVGVGEVRPNVTFFFLCTLKAPTAPQLQVNGELFEAGFYPPDALPGTLMPVQADALAAALDFCRQPERLVPVPIIETE
jgi:ADP-ribose pyrophosphatase YjhB (NUDIX family)